MATYHDIRYSTPLTNGGAQVLLKKVSVSDGDSTLTFSVLPFSFKEYIITHLNYKSSTDGEGLAFQGTTNGTDFNTQITSAHFSAFHLEDDSSTSLAYNSAAELQNGTGFQPLTRNVGSGATEGTCGFIHLYNPSGTTHVKHFMARSQAHAANDNSYDNYCSGYFNTTSAITGIQFKATSGNLESGTFKLYGVN